MINKILEYTDTYLLFLTIFLFPLFVLPIFQSSFETSKLLFLTLALVSITLLKLVKTVVSNGFKFYSSKIDILVIAFALSYVASTLFTSIGKFDSLILPGTTSFVVLSAFIYFYINQLKKHNKTVLENIIILSIVIMSILQIISFLNISSLKILGTNFSTFGSSISSFVIFASISPIIFFKIIESNKIINKVLFSFAGFIVLIGLSLSFYSVLPNSNNALKLLGLKDSWSISIDTLKTSPLVGIGPSNFLAGFNRYRPITFNSFSDWNVKYFVSRNTMLNTVVEVGIIGVIILMAIFYFSIKGINLESPHKLSILVIFVISLFLPVPVSTYPILFLLISLSSESKELNGIFSSKIPLIFLTIPFFAIMFFVTYVSYRAFYGEYLFGKVIGDIRANNGMKAYETLNKIISINPYSDRYHTTSAEISMAVANSVAKNQDITEEEKKTVSELVQQSIRETKAAVSLNQQKSANWERLGNIYSSVATFAKDADIFAIQSYGQAIFLDPINPLLRIKLGSIYFNQGKYSDAIKTYELAVLAKPDYANSHYNLAIAYKENKELDKAKEQMNITLKLIGKDSADYETARKELEDIEGLTTPTEPQSDLPI